jgi:hypothetical protein
MSERRTSGSRDRVEVALQRVLAEIHAGLRHGYFEYTLTCEVIGQGRRRLLLRAGKHYQFLIPADECEAAGRPSDPCDRGAAESSS